MSLFIHNPKASSVKGYFVNSSPITVYIEGSNDINFWYKHFEDAGYKVAVIKAGGISNLNGHKQQICTDPQTARFIVAQDADYNYYTSSEIYSHPRIISTYGYSIENTMFCIPNINNIICKYAKTPGMHYENSIATWLKELVNNLIDIIVCDIANRKKNSEIEVLKHPARYIDEHFRIKQDQVEKIKLEILAHTSEAELQAIRHEIENDPRPLTAIVRGHALTNPILNYIIKKVKAITGNKINFSNDNLYAETSFCNCTCINCKDYEYLKEKIVNAMRTF